MISLLNKQRKETSRQFYNILKNLNIFQKNSPFHDGAVVIVGNKIIAASCLVPIRERYVKQSGMRHQAGIAAAKETDALIIIVSEETGSISVAEDGVLTKGLSKEALRKRLTPDFRTPAVKGWKGIFKQYLRN